MVNRMRVATIKICLLVLVLPSIHAFCAPDDVIVAQDQNYYNPHALSLKYVLSVPPIPQDKRYRLLLYWLNRKNKKRTNWKNIELPCQRKHNIYLFIEKDCIYIHNKECGATVKTVTNAKISVHLGEQKCAEYPLGGGNGYIRFAKTCRGKINIPIVFLEFFYQTGLISMHGKNIMNYNFGNTSNFDPLDLILEIRLVDVPRNISPAIHTSIDADKIKVMDLSELIKYQKIIEEKYLTGEISIEELNLIQSRINELMQSRSLQ